MNENSPRTSAALRRLLIVVGVAVGLVIFSYGWSVTQINLERPQEPIRQQNVGNALRELLSPNVLKQDYDIQNAIVPVVMNCPENFQQTSVAPPEGNTPYILITPGCASSGEKVTVQGFNFYPDSLARINWIATDGERRIRQVDGSNEDNFITQSDGTFSVEIEVPRIRGTAGETHSVEAQGRFPSGLPRFSDTTHLVIEKMVETVFLALIATALSILPSAILSFFAAHNLMRPVRMPLGNMLITFILLPVGWAVGAALLGQLGMLAVNLGKGAGLIPGGAGAAILFFAAATSSRSVQSTDLDIGIARWRGVLNVVMIALAAVFVIGLIGGVGILLGGLLNTGILGYVGYFIGTIGRLIELTMVPIAGVIGAFGLSSIGTSLTIDGLKRIPIQLSHILGGILGFAAGAILLGFTASIGTQAAWLGLLTPIVAASLGGQLFVMIYRQFTGKQKNPASQNRLIEAVLSWGGSVLVFVMVFSFLNVGRALIEGTLPSQNPVTTILGISLSGYMLQSMLIGAALGGLAGLLAGTRAAFPIGDVLYNATRTILNGLRSIEPLIMGLVFVIWVGIGPFAGVLALTLHSIASLGKLYSEQIENIDAGPIEALQSTGANRLQTIMYAVVPQIIPPYIAFTMYRWDINVRMSTIIGFVGGGGVGFLLQQQINLLRYRDAGVAVLAIAIVVSVLDYASASIRERYV